MLRLISLSLAAVLLFAAFGVAGPKRGPRKEYLTEEELDLIREAQEIGPRVNAYMKLAKFRLIGLGLTEKTQKEIDQEKKDLDDYNLARKVAGPEVDVVKPVTDLSYLKDFTRAELLRGYIQALDEAMTNIDDFYQRKDDVRGAVETLEKFTRDTIPMLQKFAPQNVAEKTALQDALDKAKEANGGAKEALKKVPKTEKRNPPRE